MLKEDDIKKAVELDDAASEAGGFVEPMCEAIPYRIADMMKWARANGKDVEELTLAERDMFRIVPKTKAL